MTFDLAFSRFETRRNTGVFVMEDHTWKQLSPSFMRANNIPYSSVPKENSQQFSASLSLNNISSYLERLLIKGYTIKTDIIHNSIYPYVVQGVYYNALYEFIITDNAKGYGGSLQADFALPAENKLTLGVDYDFSEVHSIADYEQGYALFYVDEDREGESSTIAFFAQNEWRPISTLMISAGLRYSTIRNKVTKYRNFPDRVSEAKNSSTVGSLGVVFDASDELAIRALYSQGYRAPSLNQQLMGLIQYFQINPDLKPERSQNYELGLRYVGSGLNADLSFFYSTLKDAFYQHDTGVPIPNSVYTYQQTRNAEKAKAKGAEVAISYDIADTGLTPYVSFTAMRYERQYNNGKKTKNTGVPHSWGMGGFRYSNNYNSDLRLFGDARLTWSGGFFDEPAGNLSSGASIYGKGLKGDVTIGLEAGVDHKYQAILSFRNIGDTDFQPWGWFQPGFHIVAAVGFEY
ncbi:MAG: TonB-dependent receptor [Deltaproteobacteria bacterium]|nr:TonB-dependent receptor [Deltaproteobacteria bacterium]